MQVKGSIDHCFHLFGFLRENPADEFGVLLLHNTGQFDPRKNLSHRFWFFCLMQLQKFIDEIELFALNGEQFEDILRGLLHHRPVEPRVLGEEVVVNLVLHSVLGLDCIDSCLHYNIFLTGKYVNGVVLMNSNRISPQLYSSFFDEKIVAPVSKYLIVALGQESSSFPSAFLPTARVFHLIHCQNTVSVSLPIGVQSFVSVSVLPGELSIAMKDSISKLSSIRIAVREGESTLSAEFAELKGALVTSSVLEVQRSFTVIQIVLECTGVGELISIQIPLNSFSFFVFTLISILLIPLFSLSVDHTRFKFAVMALVLRYNCPQPMRHVLLKESEIVKSFTVQLSISFFLSLYEFPPII